MRYKHRRRVNGISRKPVNRLGAIPPEAEGFSGRPEICIGSGFLGFEISASGVGERVIALDEDEASGSPTLSITASGEGIKSSGGTQGNHRLAQGAVSLEISASGVGERVIALDGDEASGSPTLSIVASGEGVASKGAVGDDAVPVYLTRSISAGSYHSMMLDSSAPRMSIAEESKNVVTESGNVGLGGGTNIILDRE